MTARVLRPDNPLVASTGLPDARATAEHLGDRELASRADAVAARCAMDIGDVDRACQLARRSLTAAEAAGLSGWAAETAVEALQVIGRRERMRDVGSARAALERACHIAAGARATIWHIEALHELGTIEMLEDATDQRLGEASTLAHEAGAISAANVIDIKRGLLWSLNGELDRSLAITRHCERTAHRIRARRAEALAATAQAFNYAIKTDRQQTEIAAERAEGTLPGNPEVLFTTWGLARTTVSLFEGDLPRALQESDTSRIYADQVPDSAPRLAWAIHGLLRAISDEDGPATLERGRATSAAVKWNRGFQAYAEAVIEGRRGHRARASALAREGEALLRPFAARWNHLVRWLVAPPAIEDGWGDPIPWLQQASAAFTADGHARLAASCRSLLRQHAAFT